MTVHTTTPTNCCDQRQLIWGLSGSPRRWAAVFCTCCRQVHRRGIPMHEARLVRDQIEATLAGRVTCREATPCPDGGECHKTGATCGDPICVEWHADLQAEAGRKGS